MRFKMPAGPLTAKGPWAGLQDLSSFPNKTVTLSSAPIKINVANLGVPIRASKYDTI